MGNIQLKQNTDADYPDYLGAINDHLKHAAAFLHSLEEVPSDLG